ncbi:hypothetical protein [Qipengyuania sp. JC766]|uniref:hypothetical protein n=1 Tax=Qipengyuania sp. JC766 TaxID=3232139 RepID=UPI00345832B9
MLGPPALAQAQSRQAAAYVYKSEQTLRAYRRQTDAQLLELRRQISNREAQIRRLNSDVRKSSGQAGQLRAQLDRLQDENAAQQEEFTTRLASLEQQYAAQHRRLLDNAAQLSATEEGQEVLRLFNEGSPSAWARAKAMLEDRKLSRRERFAAEARAEAALYYEKVDDGQETLATVITLYEEVVDFDDTRSGDWLMLAELYLRTLRLQDSYEAAARALELGETDLELAVAAMTIGRTAILTDDQDFARRAFATAVDAARRMHDQADGDQGTLLLLQDALIAQGQAAVAAGDRETGLALLQEARALLDRALADAPGEGALRQARAAVYTALGSSLDPETEAIGAAAFLENALAELDTLAAKFPDSLALKGIRWSALSARAELYRHGGAFAPADAFVAKLVPLAEEIVAADELGVAACREEQDVFEPAESGSCNPNGIARLALARSHLLAGGAAVRAGDLDAARNHFGQAAIKASAIGRDFPQVDEVHVIGFRAMIAFGEVEGKRGNAQSKVMGYTLALETAQAVIEDAAASGEGHTSDLPQWWAARGEALAKLAESGAEGHGWEQVRDNFDRMDSLGFAAAIDRALQSRAEAEAENSVSESATEALDQVPEQEPDT